MAPNLSTEQARIVGRSVVGTMTRWAFGAVDVSRVDDPGFELVLPQDLDTTAALAARAWLAPHYVTPEKALRVGSSAIVVRTPSAVVVVDPWLAFDDPARLAPRLAALRSAGVDPDEVDLVVNTHVDGIGANVQADGSPTFPNARYLLPAAELEDLRAGTNGDERGRPLLRLADEGRLEAVTGGEQVLPGVHLEDAPGHNRGHVVVWISSGGEEAVITGHLFLHPAQIAAPETANGDLDPVVLAVTRRALLARCAAQRALLIGPLFAAPGGGRVERDGDSWRLVPA
jgi:glyoxylase-like metal-dependent hydrolase (beta-lactamase superfamily II)